MNFGRSKVMRIKEYQEVTLFFPEDFHLIQEFEKDDDWKQIGFGTMAATYLKITKDVYVKEDTNE